jgi:HEAT repeat protein
VSERGFGGDAAALLAAVGGDSARERERALESVRRVAGTDALLPEMEAALRDGGDAERRNAARSLLAALAAPGEGGGALALLERLTVEEADADVRVLAASALGESGNPEGRGALERALADPDPNVAAAAADALGSLGDPRALDALAATLRGGDPWRGIAAAVALGRLHDGRALPVLAEAARDPLLAAAAAEAVGETGDPAGLDALRAPAESVDEGARRAALEAAALLLAGFRGALPAWLREAARAAEAEVARRFAGDGAAGAARLLGAAGTPGAADALAEALHDPERRFAAEAGLRLLPPEAALDALLPRLARGEGEPCALLAALPRLPDRAAAEAVLPFLGAGDEEVRGEAADALARAADEAGARELVLRALDDSRLRLGATQALGRFPGGDCDRLSGLLSDPDPAVRTAAAEGVSRCPAPEAGPRIAAALERERDPGARRALLSALGAVGGPEAVVRLAPLVRSPDAGIRFAATRALGETRAPAALDPLLAALAEGDAALQAAALRALGELGETGDPRGADAVEARLDAGDRELRRAAADAFRRVAPPAAADRLVRALADPDWRIRLSAARTLARLEAPGARDALRAARDADPDPLVREAAAAALGEA